ncbi:T3SS effector HopA1 family protein [Amycolatopsis sp. A133]|uniref:T3SS effector HopA1 family protein n=1 Tax=Amycolatopsis sp. A133 TaxID=3064472 RepID=UPI0027EA1F70|nr:T3SS effector HopA1 family protein [Amycolatopsis sp. A133]MDQ7809133.1 T3SS effector HopA1 family protein [Amycolatopsis sp. A133]
MVAGQVLHAADPVALRTQLATALYDHFHAGESRSGAELAGFRDRLAAAVPHQLTRVHGRVRSSAAPANAVIEIDGLRVRVPASAAGAPPVGAVTTIKIDCRRPNLAPGFFLVDGSSGHGLASGDHTLRLYLHLAEPRSATAAWHAVLVFLEELGVPYRAKVSLHLPRRDALVLYLGRHAWHAAPEIAEELSGLQGLGATVSAYAHRIADGVAAAWDPADSRPGHRGLSFGEHRSRVIADALLVPGAREEELARSLAAGNVDATKVFRNTTSPDL